MAAWEQSSGRVYQHAGHLVADAMIKVEIMKQE
jgi:hypothetical protein